MVLSGYALMAACAVLAVIALRATTALQWLVAGAAALFYAAVVAAIHRAERSAGGT